MNIMKNKFFFLLLCLPLFVFLAGCAAKQERKARENIDITCASLMGCSEEEVALKLGAPKEIQNIGELKVYKYYTSYGSRSSVNGYSGTYGTWSGESATWEAFDKIDIFFRDGYAFRWDSAVKR